MANFRGHISTSGVLGVGVGAFGYFYLQYDWGTACLAGGLTAIGGMLPDLDSDSGIPVRELFGLASVLATAGPGNATYPTVKSAVDKVVNQLIFLAEDIADAQLLAPLGTRTGGTPKPDLIAAHTI